VFEVKAKVGRAHLGCSSLRLGRLIVTLDPNPQTTFEIRLLLCRIDSDSGFFELLRVPLQLHRWELPLISLSTAIGL